jgi:hypothetical protein
VQALSCLAARFVQLSGGPSDQSGSARVKPPSGVNVDLVVNVEVAPTSALNEVTSSSAPTEPALRHYDHASAAVGVVRSKVDVKPTSSRVTDSRGGEATDSSCKAVLAMCSVSAVLSTTST